MGMTNRVIPAQGGEQGATLMLKELEWGHSVKVPANSVAIFVLKITSFPG